MMFFKSRSAKAPTYRKVPKDQMAAVGKRMPNQTKAKGVYHSAKTYHTPQGDFSFHVVPGNSKIGDIAGFGTLPGSRVWTNVPIDPAKKRGPGNYRAPMRGTCCPDLPCEGHGCYAVNDQRFENHAVYCYENTALIRAGRYKEFEEEVQEVIDTQRHKAVRFSTDGDFDHDPRYLVSTVNIARRNPDTYFMCFTKDYDLIRQMERKPTKLTDNLPLHEYIPDNYKLMLSTWPTSDDDSPELRQSYRDVAPYYAEAQYLPTYGNLKNQRESWDEVCGGDCMNCMRCYTVGKDDVVYFPDHDMNAKLRSDLARLTWEIIGSGSPQPEGWNADVSDLTQDYIVHDITWHDLMEGCTATALDRYGVRRPKKVYVTSEMLGVASDFLWKALARGKPPVGWDEASEDVSMSLLGGDTDLNGALVAAQNLVLDFQSEARRNALPMVRGAAVKRGGAKAKG